MGFAVRSNFMTELLPPASYLYALNCPHDGGVLSISGGFARCPDCGRRFPIDEQGVLEFVAASELDMDTARELQGHAYDLSPLQIGKWVLAERGAMWKSYYSRNRKKTIRHLARRLERAGCDEVIFLGAGTGREIEYLMSFLKLKKVLCSDLSKSSLSIVPVRLAGYGLELGLFTSDLQRCPVASKDIPIVVVNALHHTADMHAVIESLLGRRYRNLLLVEPTGNFLIRFLTRLGLARRREYSGVIPGRLELPRMRTLCKKHGYRLSVTTHWAFPEDYYRKIFGRLPHGAFFALLDGFSFLTNFFGFGNFSILHLEAAGGNP